MTKRYIAALLLTASTAAMATTGNSGSGQGGCGTGQTTNGCSAESNSTSSATNTNTNAIAVSASTGPIANTNNNSALGGTAMTGPISNTNTVAGGTATTGPISNTVSAETGPINNTVTASTAPITNTNTPSAASNQTQSQSANNANNSSAVVYGDRFAASTAIAPSLVVGTDTCMGSSSAGGQGMSFGFSIGTSWTDKNCTRLKNARQMQAMGFAEASAQLMCQDKDVRYAMDAAGTPCTALRRREGE